MFTNIEEAINWISNRRNENLGFNHFKEVMKALDDIQDRLHIIHVAGTNGKGSVTNFLKDILINANYKVGTFTSPHLYTHLDRICVNGIHIDGNDFLRILNYYYDFFIENKLNMFEMDYIIMCAYFIEQKVDVAIVEVGLGGRLDATNVCHNPLLSIIVTIGYDHMERLGVTLGQIAGEKAGIIKRGSPVLIGNLPIEAYKEVMYKAKREDVNVYSIKSFTKLSQGHFKYRNLTYKLESIADYQIHNASCAIEAVYILNELYKMNITHDVIYRGLSNSMWKGRFERISINPNIIVDGAHNVDGIKALIESCKGLNGPRICICSILKDKDYHEMLEILESFFDEVIVTTFDFYRSSNLKDLMLDSKIKGFNDYSKALEYAKSKVENGNIVVCGSLYFISYVLSLNEQNV